MKYLSEKLTDYIVKAGVISQESYALYQYSFQIGIEMLICFLVCFGIAIYMHMIPEFVVFTGSFMLLRTYAGGVHLNSFIKCFLCSITVQIFVLIASKQVIIAPPVSWSIILCGSILIFRIAPVDNVNKELEKEEKIYCKKISMKILIGIVVFAIGCSFYNMDNFVSLTAVTLLVVLISQYIGIVKYKIEKSVHERR